MIIRPTVGRIVHYVPSESDKQSMAVHTGPPQPLASIVCHVWNDNMVNLSVFDHNGVQHVRTSVYLRQPGELPPAGMAFAEWMDYQVKTAASVMPNTEVIDKSPAGQPAL